MRKATGMVLPFTYPMPRLISTPSRKSLAKSSIIRLTGEGWADARPYGERRMFIGNSILEERIRSLLCGRPLVTSASDLAPEGAADRPRSLRIHRGGGAPASAHTGRGPGSHRRH